MTGAVEEFCRKFPTASVVINYTETAKPQWQAVVTAASRSFTADGPDLDQACYAAIQGYEGTTPPSPAPTPTP